MGKQVDKLAWFIFENVPGEPSESKGAVDTAIRIITRQQKEIAYLKEQIQKQRMDAEKSFQGNATVES